MSTEYNFNAIPEIYTKETLVRRIEYLCSLSSFDIPQQIAFIKYYMGEVQSYDDICNCITHYSYYSARVEHDQLSGEVRLLS